MKYESKSMKKEILKVIHIGSDITNTKKVMSNNGFECSTTRNNINCTKTDAIWPTYEGTIWNVEISGRKRKVNSIEVWITPS